MPRSLTRPQVGTVVWYYAANPPTTTPVAAMVVGTVNRTTFDLITFIATGNTAPALAVPYYHLGRPTGAGAWCTMPRVNENVAGKFPSNDAANPLGPGGVVV
jgi:hypothetical protein